MCSHEGGCLRDHYALGYCNAHYKRWKATGSPGAVEVQAKAPGLCSFASCDRRKSCGGLCATHYAQQHRGRTLAAINDRMPPLARDATGRKRCATCKQWHPVAAFSPETRNSDGLKNHCTRCGRNRIVAARYGITLEHYERLSQEQGDVCAICGGTNDSGRSLAVDHDHGCCAGSPACGKCARGLLCSNCNMALGLFKDDPVRLKAAIAYLALRGASRDSADGAPVRAVRGS